MNALVTVVVVVGLVFVGFASMAFNWALWSAAIEQMRTVRAIPKEARRGAAIRGTIFAVFVVVVVGLIVVEPFGEQHTAEFVIGGCGLLLLLGINVSVIWILWHKRRQ